MKKTKLFLFAVWISIIAYCIIPNACTEWFMGSILFGWGIFVAVVVFKGLNMERKKVIEQLRQMKKKPFPNYEINKRSAGVN